MCRWWVVHGSWRGEGGEWCVDGRRSENSEWYVDGGWYVGAGGVRVVNGV